MLPFETLAYWESRESKGSKWRLALLEREVRYVASATFEAVLDSTLSPYVSAWDPEFAL